MTRGQAERFRDEVRRLSDNDAAEYIMRQVEAFEAIAHDRGSRAAAGLPFGSIVPDGFWDDEVPS